MKLLNYPDAAGAAAGASARGRRGLPADPPTGGRHAPDPARSALLGAVRRAGHRATFSDPRAGPRRGSDPIRPACAAPRHRRRRGLQRRPRARRARPRRAGRTRSRSRSPGPPATSRRGSRCPSSAPSRRGRRSRPRPRAAAVGRPVLRAVADGDRSCSTGTRTTGARDRAVPGASSTSPGCRMRAPSRWPSAGGSTSWCGTSTRAGRWRPEGRWSGASVTIPRPPAVRRAALPRRARARSRPAGLQHPAALVPRCPDAASGQLRARPARAGRRLRRDPHEPLRAARASRPHRRGRRTRPRARISRARCAYARPGAALRAAVLLRRPVNLRIARIVRANLRPLGIELSIVRSFGLPPRPGPGGAGGRTSCS